MNLEFKELQKEDIKEVILLINQAYRGEKKIKLGRLNLIY